MAGGSTTEQVALETSETALNEKHGAEVAVKMEEASIKPPKN